MATNDSKQNQETTWSRLESGANRRIYNCQALLFTLKKALFCDIGCEDAEHSQAISHYAEIVEMAYAELDAALTGLETELH